MKSCYGGTDPPPPSFHNQYNHCAPPALLSLLGHFGGSNYAFKPAAIVTYSPGPWGGMRAAMSLRPVLAELGCSSISKLCGIAHVSEVLSKDGTPIDPANRTFKQLPAMLTDLEWLADAMAKQRETVGVPKYV